MFELIQLSKQSSRIREIFQNEVFSKEEQKLLQNLPNMSEEDPECFRVGRFIKAISRFYER